MNPADILSGDQQTEVMEADVTELSDLQLGLIGGGSGDVVFH